MDFICTPHTHTYIYRCIRIHIYIYIYVCIFIFIFIFKVSYKGRSVGPQVWVPGASGFIDPKAYCYVEAAFVIQPKPLASK